MTAFAMAMLVCSDLARSRAFYRDVLELRIGTDASPDWVDFDLGDGQRLGLHPDSETLMVRAGSLLSLIHISVVRVVEDFPQSGRALSGAWHRHASARTPGSRTRPDR